MRIEISNALPEAAKQIHITVFMHEQGFVDEFDALDGIATHFVLFDGEIPVATCRVWSNHDGYYVGRLAVIKGYRGRGLGQEMLEHVEQYVRAKNGVSLSLHAQCRAETFYRKCGYLPYGDVDYDEGVEHIHMQKRFE